MATFCSIPRARRSHNYVDYVFTNPTGNNLWLSCILEVTQFSLYSLPRLIFSFGLLFFEAKKSYDCA